MYFTFLLMHCCLPIKGSNYFIIKSLLQCLKFYDYDFNLSTFAILFLNCIMANNAHPDQTLRCAICHLGRHCL